MSERIYRLHYSPGACSLAVHAVLRETGAGFALVERNIRAGGVQSEDYLRLNSRARVPALEFQGQVLTEAPAILVHLGERYPASGLLPEIGTIEKFRVLEWLNFMSSTLHPLYWGVWRAARVSADSSHHPVIAATVLAGLEQHYQQIDSHLAGSRWLAGDALTLADFLLYEFVRWTRLVALPHEQWRYLNDHYSRMNERMSVRESLLAEGIQVL